MRRVFLSAVSLFLSLGWSQSKLSFTRQMERWSELGFYEKIIARYEEAPHLFSLRELPLVAEAYWQLGRVQEAFALYKQASSTGTASWEPKHLLAYAQLLHHRGEVAQAAHYYKNYAEKATDPEVATLALAQIANCQSLSTDNRYTVEKVSALTPWAPVYAAWWSGTELYAVSRSFSLKGPRDRMGIPYEKIVPHSLVRYKYHQAVIGSVGDTLLLYLSRGKGNIYYTVLGPQGWTKPQRWRRVPIRPQGRVSVVIDPKTQDIYFTHDPGVRKGTGRDIYRFIYQAGKYLPKAERLSGSINTPYDEDAPFIVGDTLYFASNGLQSAGGYDIFYAVRVGERDWGPPQRLPAPINSCADDIYYYPFSPDHTYLSSNREGTMQVYQVRFTPPPPLESPKQVVQASSPPPASPPIPERKALIGRLFDKATGKGLDGEIILVDSVSQKELAGIRTGTNGEFRLYWPEGNGKTFYLYAQSPGYMTYVQVVYRPSPTDTTAPLAIGLTPIEMEAVFALRNIYFDFNSDKLKPESFPELHRIKRLLQENPNIRIRFSGHTDNIGSDKYNQQLSERRARAVYKWLKEQGIHPIQMEYVGYGETRPIASNATDEGRALNRRIEMEVVGIRRSNPGTASVE